MHELSEIRLCLGIFKVSADNSGTPGESLLPAPNGEPYRSNHKINEDIKPSYTLGFVFEKPKLQLKVASPSRILLPIPSHSSFSTRGLSWDTLTPSLKYSQLNIIEYSVYIYKALSTGFPVYKLSINLILVKTL